MRKLIVVGFAGVLVGVMLMTLIPAQAHHKDRKYGRRIAALERQVASLNTFASCFEVVPATQYGTETEGYQYRTTGGVMLTTTALNVTVPQTPRQYWLGNISDECVGTTKRFFKKASVHKAVRP